MLARFAPVVQAVLPRLSRTTTTAKRMSPRRWRSSRRGMRTRTRRRSGHCSSITFRKRRALISEGIAPDASCGKRRSARDFFHRSSRVRRRKLVTRQSRSARESSVHAEDSTLVNLALLRERSAVGRRRRSNRPGNSQAHEPRNRTIRLWKETQLRVRRRDNILRQRYRGGTRSISA